MTHLTLIRSKHLHPFASLLNQAGEQVGRILTKARLPGDCLDDPETPIPANALFHFREHAGRALGTHNIALDATRNLQLATLGEFGQALLSAPTLYRLLTTFRDHFQTQSTIVKLELVRCESGDVRLCFRFHDPPEFGVWHSDLYTLQWALKVVRLVTPTWSPAQVWSMSSPERGRREVCEEFNVEQVDFGRDCTGFVIPSSMLALPLTNNKMRGAKVDDELLRQTTLPTSTTDSLRHAIRSYAGESWLSIGEVAEVFDSSARTIQRQLTAERTSYTRLIEQTRMEIAGERLESTEIAIADIARQVGYTHQANFTRAFRRWAGVSPRQYRHQRSFR